MNVYITHFLKQFCDPDPNWRYAIDAPFVQNGRIYATDGKMLVSLPAEGEPDTESDRKLPKAAEIFGRFDDVKEWKPASDIVFPGAIAIAGDCTKCNGKGLVHHPCECECGNKHDSPEASICGCHVMFGNRAIATHFALKVGQLPGCEWGVADLEDTTAAMFLRFQDGGRGAVMPLDLRHDR